jgi:predicted nucleotidyltransferase
VQNGCTKDQGVIPALDDIGLLPPGVWECTLAEAEEVFATTPHRRELWKGFLQFLADEVEPHTPVPIWIDGSFTRRKDHPSDIDVVVDFSDLPEAVAMPMAVSLYLRNSKLKAAYKVDAYPRHPEIANDFAAFFQYAGSKAAAEFQIDSKHPKGILRVQL